MLIVCRIKSKAFDDKMVSIELKSDHAILSNKNNDEQKDLKFNVGFMQPPASWLDSF